MEGVAGWQQIIFIGGLIAGSVAATYTVVRNYYTQQKRMGDAFDGAIGAAMERVKDGFDTVHKRIDRTNERALDGERNMRKEIKSEFVAHETRMDAKLDLQLKALTSLITKNGHAKP